MNETRYEGRPRTWAARIVGIAVLMGLGPGCSTNGIEGQVRFIKSEGAVEGAIVIASTETDIKEDGDVPRSVESRLRFRPDIYATFSLVSSEFLLTTASNAAIS